MQVEIGSLIKIKNPSSKIKSWCIDNLTLSNPLYQQMKKMGKDDVIKFKHIPEHIKSYVVKGETLIIPFGCLYALWPFIKDSELKLSFNDNGDISIKNKLGPELYDYQEEAVSKMVAAKGGILVSPCGSGKTFMGIEIIKRLGKKFLWLTHTKDLLNQTYSEFKKLYPNIDIGLITEGKIDIGKDGAIATVQTLDNIDPMYYSDEFDVVVADECAHCVGSPPASKMFSRIMGNIPARYKYGLTATPSRSDTLINTMYMILGVSKDGLFEATHKVPKEKIKTMVAEHKLFTLNTKIEDKYETNLYEPDGTIKYANLIKFLSNDEERNNTIIDNVIKCNEEGRKQVILCNLVEQGKILNELCHSKGLNSVFICGSTPKKTREDVLIKNTDNWNILIATYSLLKEGINVKALDTLHMATPQKDKALIVQCVGRIERYLEGKKQPIAYDYVDTNISYCWVCYNQRKKHIKNRF